MDDDQVRRQLLVHLRNLRGAGIEWLPKHTDQQIGPAARSLVVDTPTSTSISEVSPSSLDLVGALSLDERRTALTVLAAEVAKCMKCPELCSTRTQTVFAHGEPGIELCFVGEAPGADEDAQGLPFVGAAGQLLNRIIAACGMKREEVYICNILKCRPPNNRTPLANEAANCRGFLERQLELVRPKYIVALGGCAATNLLNTTLSLGKLRGTFHDFNGIPVMVTYHPAFLLPHRSPHMKAEVWKDMKMLLAKMGRPVQAPR